MHSTPPSPQEIAAHVDWTVASIAKLLSDHSVAARIERHEQRGIRRVIVTLDLSRPTLRQPRRVTDCEDL